LRPHPSGDGTLFVSDQNGIIYRINDGNAEIFLDARTYIKDFQSGPGIATGVGSFDFHPDFLNNGLLYITHAEIFKGQHADYLISDSIKAEVQWILSEWKMDRVKDNVFKGTHRELLRLHAPTFGHGAQDIGFIPGLDKKDPNYGLLYFGFGDGGSNNIRRPEMGHRLKSFLGTILRIDPSGNNSRNGKYGIPADNPFVNETDPSAIKEIYAYGFRNPHRLAWDQTNGNRMMVTDIGESNIEEINIVEKGGDYGWPNREGNYGIATTKDLKTVYKLSESDLDFYKRPFAQYDHEEGNAISGGYVYEGDLLLLKNKYVFGDIVNGKLFYVNIDPQLSDSTIYELAILQNGKNTDLREMSHTKRLHLRIGYDRFAKELYVITKVDGKIRRISKVY
jgi:glucose/arabinose dehydrogenase